MREPMNDSELLRYSRQIMLPEIEIAGQERLRNAHVLIVGLGGLGCPVAMYLAAAGIGHLTLADDDEVELSNLQRQIAHATCDIGKPKVTSARETLLELNENVEVTSLQQRLDRSALRQLVAQVDLVIDATDNFKTRFEINDACVETHTPAIYAAAIRLEGQLLVYDGKQTSPCYQCLYKGADDAALNCAEAGVAAPLVGIIGSMQAMEAIRLLVGIEPSSAGFLQAFDAKTMEWHKFRLPKSENCPGCGKDT